MALPDIGDIFKKLVWDAAVKALISALFSAIPWLGWGPVGIVVGFVVTILSDKLYSLLKLAVNFTVIEFKNEEHRRVFDDAALKLKIIARDKGIESEEFRAERKIQVERLSKFVKWNIG